MTKRTKRQINAGVEKMLRGALLVFDVIDFNVEKKNGDAETYRVTPNGTGGVHVQSMYDHYRDGKDCGTGLTEILAVLSHCHISSVSIGRD